MNTVISIILGLIGLGILVVAHELGHYLMARLVGVRVEAFSIGWGKKLIGKKIGDTEWIISLFPLGGYCKLAGENVGSEEALPGDLYYGKAWRRLLVVVGGPLFSLLFALILFMASSMMSYNIVPGDTKIVVNRGAETEFQTGDIIKAINQQPVQYDFEWMRLVTAKARQPLTFTVLRHNELISLTETPTLYEDGRGFLPIAPWIDPVVGDIVPGSAAEGAQLKAGDHITAVNGKAIKQSQELREFINNSEGKPVLLNINRDGAEISIDLQPKIDEESGRYLLGIMFAQPKPIKVAGLPFLKAVPDGFHQFGQGVKLYLHGLANLFHGVKLTKALSGPVQTTYIIGEVAQSSITGDSKNIVSFLAFISMILGIMNLLPIPLVDGGMIVLYLIEWIRNKVSSEKVLRIYQTVGMIFISLLILLAVFSDILALAS